MAPWLPKRERENCRHTGHRANATQENTLYRRSSPIAEMQRPRTQEMAFSRPTTAAVTGPKMVLSSGLVGHANDSGFIATAEHSAEQTSPLTDLVTDPPGDRTSDTSSETPVRVTDEQRISPCSRIHACCKKQSGEICRERCCSHPQLKRVSVPPPPNATQQTSISTNGFSPSNAPPGPGPSDDDSDSDSLPASPGNCSWHSMDRHSGRQLASLIYPGSFEPNSYSMDSTQVETDHGCSHAAAAGSHDLEPFCMLWSVQESNTQRPGQQELVVAEPLKFVVTPIERRDSLQERRHVYTKPFVCNMPELQPSFVGEMTSECI